MMRSREDGLRRVSSAAVNLSALVDDIAKRARKNFKETGSPDVDAKFLKESVGALKDLLELLEEETPQQADGITVRMEGAAGEWGK